MLLADLIEGQGLTVAEGDPGAVRVCDITEDSRTVVPGSVFIARRGERRDGAAFITAAIDAGAVGLLVDRVSAGEAARAADARACVLAADDVALAGARLAERHAGNPLSLIHI